MQSNILSSETVERHAKDDAGFSQLIEDLARRRRIARRRRTILISTAQVFFVIVLLGSWQLFAGDPKEESWVLIDHYYVSRPVEIFSTLAGWVYDGSIWAHVLATAQATAIGFLIGASLGLVAGVVLGANNTIGQILSPFVSAANSVPRLALVPLFVLWFGLGLASKVALIVVIVFFLVFFSTFDGVRQTPIELLNTMRIMGATRRQVLGKVTIPSAMVWMFSGLRVSVPFALVGAVTAEIISSNRGLGYLLVRSANQFFVSGVFASIVVMVLLSMAMLSLVLLLQRWLLRWDPSRLK
jgi:NitT/TauT family transport system permease protein